MSKPWAAAGWIIAASCLLGYAPRAAAQVSQSPAAYEPASAPIAHYGNPNDAVLQTAPTVAVFTPNAEEETDQGLPATADDGSYGSYVLYPPRPEPPKTKAAPVPNATSGNVEIRSAEMPTRVSGSTPTVIKSGAAAPSNPGSGYGTAPGLFSAKQPVEQDLRGVSAEKTARHAVPVASGIYSGRSRDPARQISTSRKNDPEIGRALAADQLAEETDAATTPPNPFRFRKARDKLLGLETKDEKEGNVPSKDKKGKEAKDPSLALAPPEPGTQPSPEVVFSLISQLNDWISSPASDLSTIFPWISETLGAAGEFLGQASARLAEEGLLAQAPMTKSETVSFPVAETEAKAAANATDQTTTASLPESVQKTEGQNPFQLSPRPKTVRVAREKVGAVPAPQPSQTMTHDRSLISSAAVETAHPDVEAVHGRISPLAAGAVVVSVVFLAGMILYRRNQRLRKSPLENNCKSWEEPRVEVETRVGWVAAERTDRWRAQTPALSPAPALGQGDSMMAERDGKGAKPAAAVGYGTAGLLWPELATETLFHPEANPDRHYPDYPVNFAEPEPHSEQTVGYQVDLDDSTSEPLSEQTVDDQVDLPESKPQSETIEQLPETEPSAQNLLETPAAPVSGAVAPDFAAGELGGLQDEPEARDLAAENPSRGGGLPAVAETSTVPAPLLQPETKPARLPVPEASAQARAESLIKKFYKADYDKRGPEDMRTLAVKLLQQGLDVEDDPAARFVLLREACDLSARAFDVSLSLKGAERIARAYDVDVLELKTATLERASAVAGTPAGNKELGKTILALLIDAIRADKFPEACRLLKLAFTAARKSGSAALLQAVRARAKELEKITGEYADAERARATLAQNPQDPGARLKLGKYECLIKGDWDAGLPLLMQGSDPKLQELAKKDLAAPCEAAKQVALGDGWLKLARSNTGLARGHLLVRAHRWYRLALPELGDTARARIKKRIACIEKHSLVRKQLPGSPSTAGMKLALIPCGKFRMKSTPVITDAALPLPVEGNEPFYLGVHEVTVAQFRIFVEETGYTTEAERTSPRDHLPADGAWHPDPRCTWKDPGWEQDDEHPVACVSWNDAIAFCQWLSKKDGKNRHAYAPTFGDFPVGFRVVCGE